MKTKILDEFGLTKNEQAIFLAIVKKGTISATAIAKHTGLNRPYVYYALERLLEKGYISQIMIKGKKHFNAIDLDQISILEEHKLELFKKYLQDLKKFQQKEKNQVEVEVWKGKYAIRNVHKKILAEVKKGEEILYLGLKEEVMENFEPIFIRKILNHFQKNNIKERVIIKKDGKKLSYAKTTKYKHLSQELLGDTSRTIYQDTIIDLIYDDPIYVVITKNKKLANVAKKQFEIFWNIAKK